MDTPHTTTAFSDEPLSPTSPPPSYDCTSPSKPPPLYTSLDIPLPTPPPPSSPSATAIADRDSDSNLVYLGLLSAGWNLSCQTYVRLHPTPLLPSEGENLDMPTIHLLSVLVFTSLAIAMHAGVSYLAGSGGAATKGWDGSELTGLSVARQRCVGAGTLLAALLMWVVSIRAVLDAKCSMAQQLGAGMLVFAIQELLIWFALRSANSRSPLDAEPIWVDQAALGDIKATVTSSEVEVVVVEFDVRP
ncbi:cysteine proteinase [Pseudohyphozyma bogoriensis]|nr:cysteine proteinase [Pseudohyphozyma bogoriensis]